MLLKKQPPKGRKLLVLGTTSVASVMEDMEITTSFNVVLNVPKLREQEIKKVFHALGAFAPQEVSAKQLILELCTQVRAWVLLAWVHMVSADAGLCVL